jgi:hypothetical protein
VFLVQGKIKKNDGIDLIAAAAAAAAATGAARIAEYILYQILMTLSRLRE